MNLVVQSDTGHCVIIPEWVLERAPNECITLYCLISLCATRNATPIPIATLARRLGVDERTIRRRLKALVACDALSVEAVPGDANRYTVHLAKPELRGGVTNLSGVGAQSTANPPLDAPPSSLPSPNTPFSPSNPPYNPPLSQEKEKLVSTSLRVKKEGLLGEEKEVERISCHPSASEWEGDDDWLVRALGEAIAAVPKYQGCSRAPTLGALRGLAGLLREAGAPSDDDLLYFIAEWREFHKIDVHGRYGKADPVASLRNNIDRYRPRWAQERRRRLERERSGTLEGRLAEFREKRSQGGMR